MDNDDENLIRWSDLFERPCEGEEAFRVCLECGALVSELYLSNHTRWHINLREQLKNLREGR